MTRSTIVKYFDQCVKYERSFGSPPYSCEKQWYKNRYSSYHNFDNARLIKPKCLLDIEDYCLLLISDLTLILIFNWINKKNI